MKKKMRLFLSMMMIALVVAVMMPMTAKADYGRPTRVTIPKSSITVSPGRKFEVRARISPTYADDDYVRWQIVSGKSYVRFEDDDYDREGDDMEFVAVKPGKAKIRCYVVGKNRSKYGDTITVTVKQKAPDYSLNYGDSQVQNEELGDDFDLEVIAGYSISDSQLVWSIADPTVVGFEFAGMTTGREVEFRALKAGTTTITCTNTNPNATTKSLTFTVNVSSSWPSY